MSVPFGKREDRLQAIIAATIRRQGFKPKRKGWITKQQIQELQRERFLHRVKAILTEE